MFVQELLEKFGIPPNWADALAWSAGMAYGVKTVGISIINKLAPGAIGGPAAWVITGGIFLVTLVFTLKDTKYVVERDTETLHILPVLGLHKNLQH